MNVNTATRKVQERFAPLTGQPLAKEALTEIIVGGLEEEGFIAPTFIVGATGFGKTAVLDATRASLKDLYPSRKKIYYQSAKEMESADAFFEDCLVPHMHGQDATLVIDEFHEAPAGCQSIIRQAVEVTSARASKEIKRKDWTFLYEPNRHAIFLATNRIDKVDPAIVSRFERIDLESYTDEDIEQILFRGLQEHGYHFHENSLRILAECGRGNARDVIHWQNAVRRYLAIAGKMTLNKEDVRTILRRKRTLPLGVTRNELKTLLILEGHGGQQLAALAARNLCSSDEQKSNEKYLNARGLIRIDGVRYISDDGRAYLAELRKGKFIV